MMHDDTAEFAVNAIRRWHETMGRERYPVSDRLMITADGGGSNGSRVRLWKIELQKLADTTGLTLWCATIRPARRNGTGHHAELAWPAADEPLGYCRADRRNHNKDRSDGPLRT